MNEIPDSNHSHSTGNQEHHPERRTRPPAPVYPPTMDRDTDADRCKLQWKCLIVDENSKKIVDNAVKADDILNSNIASQSSSSSARDTTLSPRSVSANMATLQLSNGSKTVENPIPKWMPSTSSAPNRTLSTASWLTSSAGATEGDTWSGRICWSQGCEDALTISPISASCV